MICCMLVVLVVQSRGLAEKSCWRAGAQKNVAPLDAAADLTFCEPCEVVVVFFLSSLESLMVTGEIDEKSSAMTV